MKKIDVVYCLIYDDKSDKILMVHNGDVDSWTMPGGKVEKGETLEDAAIRELKEETGYDIKLEGIVSVNECFFESLQEHAVFFTFEAKIIGGDLMIADPEEIFEVAWVDIPVADKLMPYHLGGVRQLLKSRIAYNMQGTV